MRLEVGCSIRMHCPQQTPLILLLRPRSGVSQWVEEERYILDPHVPVDEYVDGFGNLCQRLVAPVGPFRIETHARVRTVASVDVAAGAPFVPVPQLPDSVLAYLLPSRFCESDRLGAMATDLVSGERPGYDQVAAVSRWVNQHIRYRSDSDPAPVSATEVRARGNGVCRDLTHLAIALCRAINIPARMIAGYAQDLEPMDLHAWFEAWVGGRWYTFDPTQPQKNNARVVLAQGRDAADIPVYNQFGPPVIPEQMHVAVRPLN